MNNCPLCQGQLITKVSSAGDEIYCSGCRSIIASATLEFKFAANDTGNGGGVEQCTIDGFPGWKGPGDKARCYPYDPGDHESEERAKAKATQSAYMETRKGHTTKLVTGMFDGQVIPGLTGVGPIGMANPKSPVDTDLVHQMPETVNNSGLAVAAGRKTAIAMPADMCSFGDALGDAQCTNCGLDHPGPCPEQL